MMGAVIRMPAAMAGASEATIQSWLVEVGDVVDPGRPVAEIETEKAVFELEAESGGVVVGLLAEAGASIAVGDPIAVLGEPGESADGALADAGVAAPPATVAAPPPTVAPQTSAAADPTSAAGSGPPPQPGAAPARRLFASPLVRRLAAERGIDLTTVRGSGPAGRIVRRDIDALPAPAAPPAEPAPVAAASAPSTTAADEAPSAGYVDTPHTGMRRAIARRLAESKSTVPHFYLAADCVVDELLALRSRINESQSVKVSVNDLVIKAVACAMQDVPEANAIWTDDATRRFDSVDIAMAVSVPNGLFTPVIRGVEALTLTQLSSAASELARRARGGGLRQRELEGGSFSVSNLGMFGTTEFSAIINPPHAGILAVGAATRRPVAVGDEVRVASVMTVTLSADHRVLDGALAARWLRAFVTRIENPIGILV